MAKDRKKLLHIHSSIPDKQPTPSSIEVGEIAVNNAANQEFLSIKNSEDKIKRFSSDEQIITWMEKKEVMPYEGYTRGSDGPAGATGPDSVTNDDLLQNKSNLIIKLNQVAATNTVKHDKVNGAKDIYGNCVNPTSDSGVTDGAGFAIDMSRYAMIGANPSFSSLTVTDKTDLSGNTTIADGDGTGTRSGHTLTIKTTDVVANDTNWTETITNKQSTVTNETDKITTLNESATTRNTTVGTETLHVSGTTTETHDKDVTITNNSGVTETTKGNVVENVSGTTTINHSGDTTTNESGNTVFNTNGNTTFMTSGNTVIHSDGAVGITAVDDIVATSSESSIIITANDDLCETAGDVAAFKGANKTNVGIDCSDAGRTTVTNVYGDTINERANTADTRVTSAYTSATTATTIIGTANTSATTANLSGNTLVVNEATSISAKTPTAYVSGTTLDVKETNTDITSCGRISANTNDFEVKQCATNGKAIINSDDVDISGKTFDVVETTSATIKAPATTISGTSLTLDEGTSISAKTPSTTISGTNFTLNESNTVISSCTKIDLVTDDLNITQCSEEGGTADFEFCNGFNVKSNAVNFEQCSTAGTFTIKEKATNISGETLTIRESGATDFSGGTLTTTTSGNTTMNVSGNTAINTSGTTTIKTEDGTTIQTTAGNTNINTSGNTNITSTGTTTLTSTGTTTIEATGANSDICISATDSARIYGKGSTYVGVKCDGTAGSATTVEGTTLNLSGSTVNVDATDYDLDATNVCVSGATKANFYGKQTNIGIECGGTIATATTVEGVAVSVSGTNIDVDAAENYCLSAGTKANIYGKATNIGIECGGTIATATTIEGTTVGISGGTTNVSGGTINISGGSITETSSGKTCIQAGTDLNIGGDTSTKVGANCEGNVYSNNTTIYASTAVTINAPTTNITGNTNISGNTVIGGDTNISGDTVIGGNLSISGTVYGLKDLTITSGTTSIQSPYNGSAAKSITIPSDAMHLFRNTLEFQYGTPDTGKTSYDPGAGAAANVGRSSNVIIPTSTSHLSKSTLTINYGNIYSGTKDTSYNTEAAKTITIPDSLSNVSNGNAVDSSPSDTSGKITIKKNLEVSGTVTATGAIYSSDRNLKENIKRVTNQELDNVGLIEYKSFNFKNDESKHKVYGVIAQEVQDAGLSELVYTNEDGTLAVDYTSLTILKLAKLTRENDTLLGFFVHLQNKIAELEQKVKELENKD